MRVDFQRPFATPEGARELLLVRHGAVTAMPEDGSDIVVGGRSDPPLNDAGREQAAAIAEALAEEPIGAVFASPLRRTGETAAPLVARTAHEPVVVTDLTEVFLGDWEGRQLAARAANGDPEFRRVLTEQRWELIPGAETAAAFAERIRRGVDAVAAAAEPGELAVVFSHSAVIAEVLRQVTGSEPFAFMQVSNGSFTRLVHMPDGRYVLVSFNETSHLPAAWRPGGARR